MKARVLMIGGRVRVRGDLLLTCALFAGFFPLYARTVTPGVLDGDGGEFQTNIFRLGVSHTGYPLYFLLAKTWTVLFPLGSVAYRANLFSALFGAGATALLYPALRYLVRSRAASLAAAVLFGASQVEWSQALIPDVYTLNSFLIILVLFVAVLWRVGRVRLEWLLFVYGLSLAHHRTMIWFGPALALWILFGEGRALLSLRRLLQLGAAFALPLLLYLYIPLRGDSDVGVEYHARNITDMILATNVSISLKFGPPGFIWERITTVYLPLLIEQFTPVGFLFGIVGAAGLALGRVPVGWPEKVPARQWLAFIGLAHLFETAFGIVFWVVDSEIFFIPSYLTFVFLVAVGIALAWDSLAGMARSRPGAVALRLTAPALGLAVTGLALWLAQANYARVDRSWDDEADLRWQEILSLPLEPRAWIVGNWESLTPLEYYQYVEGRRADLRRDKIVLFKDQLRLALPQDALVQRLTNRLEQGGAVYFTVRPSSTETLSDVVSQFETVPDASLWRLQRGVQITARSIDARLDDSVVLQSAGFTPDNPQPGDWITVQLDWVRPRPEGDRSQLSLLLTDAGGKRWMETRFASTSAVPRGDSQTSANAGERQGLYVPPDAPPGVYSLSLAIGDSANEPGPIELGDLTVVPAVHPWPAELIPVEHRVSTATPLGRLVGWRLSESRPRPGDTVDLETWWESASNGQIQVILRDSTGRDYHLANAPLFPAAFLPGTGQIVRAQHDLRLPVYAAPGQSTIDVEIAGQRFHLLDVELQPSGRLFDAPALSQVQRATLGESIELVGYNLDRTQAGPGDTVSLMLGWHAKESTEGSYKVFVHLLAPDGTLVAQKDSYPRNGTLTTNRWVPGEYVLDEYRLELPSGLAPGVYRFEIGMYSEASGARLAARDENGRPVDGERILLTTALTIRR